MLCTYCQQKTQVINSRNQKNRNNVWRRRQCIACKKVVTTIEYLDHEKSWVVQYTAKNSQPFMRDKLFISIYKSIQHRPSALQDALGLTATVMAAIKKSLHEGSIDRSALASQVYTTLHHFDKPAAVHYAAFHSDAL